MNYENNFFFVRVIHEKHGLALPELYIVHYRCLRSFKMYFIRLLQKDFEWNDSERASVLGSFFWFHWAMQLPGGVLARTFGAKRIFGLSNLFMFAMSLIMPLVARWNIKGLIVARALQGFVGVRII